MSLSFHLVAGIGVAMTIWVVAVMAKSMAMLKRMVIDCLEYVNVDGIRELVT